MATTAKQARGTKRTCQNGECGSRFYDLNRDPIVCPVCGGVYEIAHSPLGAAAVVEEKVVRKPKKPEFAGTEANEIASPEAEEELAEIESDEEIASDGGDETFLEEEEDEGGDVSGIIGGPVAEGEEES